MSRLESLWAAHEQRLLAFDDALSDIFTLFAIAA
jgi:hypothetical protein